MKYDVFISYSSKDQKVVEAVKAKIKVTEKKISADDFAALAKEI